MTGNSACNYDAVANIVAGCIKITTKYTLCANRSASSTKLRRNNSQKSKLSTHISKRGYVEFTYFRSVSRSYISADSGA
jgi:hypothetical protein